MDRVLPTIREWLAVAVLNLKMKKRDLLVESSIRLTPQRRKIIFITVSEELSTHLFKGAEVFTAALNNETVRTSDEC